MTDVAAGTPVLAGGSPEPSGGRLSGKVLRYAGGSVVATVCSQATFLLVYGPLHATPAVSSTLAWLAGAVPNYWMNRRWTWRSTGRPSLRREVVPYVAIVLGTLLVAILATSAGAHALAGTTLSHAARTVIVTGIYFAVYAVMFVFRFLLFDRLFRAVHRRSAQ